MLKRKLIAAFLCQLMLVQPEMSAQDQYDHSNRWLQTEHFAFKIPSPWNYAIPKNDGKNQARCFLESKLQMFAKGLFIVDAGYPQDGIQETLVSLMEGMAPKGKALVDIELDQKEIKLDGVTAMAFLTDETIASTPCMTIVCFNNDKKKLFLLFASVSTSDGLKHRDAMLESLEKTWLWR